MEWSLMESLLDSVILIDHLNGIEKATGYLAGLVPERQAISVATRAEILVGVSDAESKIVKTLLDQYNLLSIDKETADLAAELRKKHGWKLPDAFQAALCIQHGLKLVTRNTKDFNPEKYKFVKIPYTI
jgi:predicted nucleic acid-binding protein